MKPCPVKNNSKLLTRLLAVSLAVTMVIILSFQVSAAPPSFDLDLKELKKPHVTSNSVVKKPLPARKEEKQPPGPDTNVKSKKTRPVQKVAKKPSANVEKKVEHDAVVPSKSPVNQEPVKKSVTTEKLPSVLPERDRLYYYFIMPFEPEFSKFGPIPGTLREVAVALPPVSLEPKTITPEKVPVTELKVPIQKVAPKPVTPSESLKKEHPEKKIENPVIIEADSICNLTCKLLDGISELTTVDELLNDGANLAAASAGAIHAGVSAVLFCGLPRAEEYTVRRLLEMQGVGVISVSGDDSIEHLVHSVTSAMGISFRLVSRKDSIYSFINSDGRESLIKLSLKPVKRI